MPIWVVLWLVLGGTWMLTSPIAKAQGFLQGGVSMDQPLAPGDEYSTNTGSGSAGVYSPNLDPRVVRPYVMPTTSRGQCTPPNPAWTLYRQVGNTCYYLAPNSVRPGGVLVPLGEMHNYGSCVGDWFNRGLGVCWDALAGQPAAAANPQRRFSPLPTESGMPLLPPPYNALPPDDQKIARQCGAGRPGSDWHAIEVCILLAMHHNPNWPQYYLPNLTPGRVIALSPMTPKYNCYGYACDPLDPKEWVKDMPGLVNYLKTNGWVKLAERPLSPPPPGIMYLVLYGEPPNTYHHAAIWSSYKGVVAKMGVLGTFQFNGIDTLSGGYFGNPIAFYQHAEAPPR
jgi:hypothetical protein